MVLVNGLTISIVVCLYNAVTFAHGDVNINDDTWVMTNMMKHISNHTAAKLGMFTWNNNTPCDWNFISCDYVGRVADIELRFNPVVGDYINTTYWPSMIRSIWLDAYNDSYNVNLGSIILDNLPNTTESFNVYGSSFHLDLTTFPNLSHISGLYRFEINVSCHGVATDLGLKLPNLNYLYLHHFAIDKFPNFINFTRLELVEMYYCNITNDDSSFVSSTLAPNLKELHSHFIHGLTGELDFRSLMPYSPNLTRIVFGIVGDTKFQSVDFRGINDDTYVTLPLDIGCTANSVFGDNNSFCFNSRLGRDCTGEDECLSLCQCFEIANDWQPALNDFYTYVKNTELYVCDCF